MRQATHSLEEQHVAPSCGDSRGTEAVDVFSRVGVEPDLVHSLGLDPAWYRAKQRQRRHQHQWTAHVGLHYLRTGEKLCAFARFSVI
jgi:hypothetical protein